MSGGAAFPGRSQTGLAQEAAQGLAAEGEALDLAKFFAEVVIVEAGIGGACQTDDGLPYAGRQAAGARSSAVGVGPRRPPPLPPALFLLPARNWKSRSLVAVPSDSTRMSFLSWGDIFTLLLRGDRIMELRHRNHFTVSRTGEMGVCWVPSFEVKKGDLC